MKFDQGKARTVGICVVLGAIVLGTIGGLWYRSEPDKRLATQDTGGTEETPNAVLEEPTQDAVGEMEIGWFVADRSTVESNRLPLYQETFTDAELVKLASDMQTWTVGTHVAFDIPHASATVESVIDRVETGLAGNISYIGRVIGQDIPHRMVVTVGARNVFAYISSARGSYEMVGNREFGWLMTSEGMDRHVDYSKPDYYLPQNTQQSDP